MGFNINYGAILQRIKEVSVIDTETVMFVRKGQEECPDCFYDPVSKAGSDPFCPTCHGTGQIVTLERIPVRAGVDRVRGTEHVWEPGGRLQTGTVILTVHADELIQAGFDLEGDWVQAFSFVEIGRARYRIADSDSVIPQTLNGQIYEMIFHLSRDKKKQAGG